MNLFKHYSLALFFTIFCCYPLITLGSSSYDFMKNLYLISNALSSQNMPEQEVKLLISRLEQLAIDNQKLKLENDNFKKQINELDIKNQKLLKDLETCKPQNLPTFKSSDLETKDFNLERILRLRSADCFDHNGDMSCMYTTIDLEGGKIGYLLYKANRVFNFENQQVEIVNDEGYKLDVLTKDNANKIKKWERENPDLLIILSDY